jgi:chromosome segregation ATPase
MTDTPETDANDDAWAHNMQYDTFNSLMDTPLEWDEFARKLERERDEAREQRDGLRSGIDYASDRLTTVTEQRDRLTEALEYILGIGLTEKTRAKAEKALQSLTNNQND